MKKLDYSITADENFSNLYRVHYPSLKGLALKICGNTEDAEDAVQDSFILAFTRFNQLKKNESFLYWIRQITARTSYKLVQSKKSNRKHVGILTSALPLAEEIFEKTFSEIQTLNNVHTALSVLSDELRSAMLLRYYSETDSYEEISIILSIPVGTVRSRLAEGRKKISAYWKNFTETSDREYRKDLQWSEYYSHHWKLFFLDPGERKKFFSHFSPDLTLFFTSGKIARGRIVLEKMLEEDLEFGSSLMAENIVTSGNITLLEGKNLNSPEFPFRCPPKSSLVFFRQKGAISRLHLFNSENNS